MKVKKIITNSQTEELDIFGVTLLSTEEAKALPARLRIYNDGVWWLRSPGRTCNGPLTAAVSGFPLSAGLIGCIVTCDDVWVRPALKIKIKSSNFKIGDCFLFDEKEFEVITETLAFCKSDIGKHCFRNVKDDENANDYEASDVKKFVDEWFGGVKNDI